MRHLNHLVLVLCGLLMLPVCAFAQDAAAPADNSGDVTYQPRVIESAETTEEAALARMHELTNELAVIESAETTEEAAVEEVAESPRLPRTAKDNFGGFRFGGDIMAGVGRCDEKNCLGQSDDDWDKENMHVAGALQIGLGYLWGNEVFAGPELNISGGYPFLGAGDIRIRLVMPVNYNNAITMSAGWGMTYRFKILDKFGHYIVVDDNAHPTDDEMPDIIRNMYIPVQVGYEHAFDNGFIFGVTLEARMTFNSETNVLGTKEERRIMQGRALEEHPHLTFGMATAGFHMGYAF